MSSYPAGRPSGTVSGPFFFFVVVYCKTLTLSLQPTMHRCEICGYDNWRATCQGDYCVKQREREEKAARAAARASAHVPSALAKRWTNDYYHHLLSPSYSLSLAMRFLPFPLPFSLSLSPSVLLSSLGWPHCRFQLPFPLLSYTTFCLQFVYPPIICCSISFVLFFFYLL